MSNDLLSMTGRSEGSTTMMRRRIRCPGRDERVHVHPRPLHIAQARLSGSWSEPWERRNGPCTSPSTPYRSRTPSRIVVRAMGETKWSMYIPVHPMPVPNAFPDRGQSLETSPDRWWDRSSALQGSFVRSSKWSDESGRGRCDPQIVRREYRFLRLCRTIRRPRTVLRQRIDVKQHSNKNLKKR